MPTYNDALRSMFKELYNTDPPWYVIAHRESKLSKLESLIYEKEIEEYKNLNYDALYYSKNPFLSLITQKDEFKGQYVPIPIIIEPSK